MTETNDTIVPTVYVAIGCPGSGKSTWWEAGIKSNTIPGDKSIRINMDSIRKEVCGNETDQSKNGIVAKIASQNLKNSLSHRIPVIYWDNTSARPKYRKEVIKEAKRANYKVVGIWFNLPLKTCLERNAKRSRVVPPDVITRIHNDIQMNTPTLDEGFDNIIYVESD